MFEGELFNLFKIDIIAFRLLGLRFLGIWRGFVVKTFLFVLMLVHLLTHFPEFLLYLPRSPEYRNNKAENKVI